MGRRSPALLVALGFALLLAAWVVASQPFSAPDEGSHYLRALSIANGHLLGPKIPYPTPLIPAQRAFVNQDTRAVLVPAVLGPNVTRCIDGRPNVSGSCVEASPTGDYYPPAYLLPALAIKVSNRTDTALWLGRALSTALCFVFVALSVALLWDGSAWSLLGLLAAITPMVLFISSVLNPSGLDTVASVAFASAGIRIGRGPDRVRPWIWIAFVLSGALTALSFQAGPAFLVADLVVVAALAGSGRLGDLRRSQRRPLVTAGLILLAALVLWFVYARVSGASHSQFGVSPFFHSLRVGLHQLGAVLRDAIGTFSTLTVHLPAAVCWVWWLLVLAGVAAALWLGSRRERVLMILVLLLALAFPVLAYAWFYRHSGFPMQGRQVLPVLVLIPLTAGELIRRHRDRIAFRARAWVLAVPIGVIAILQGYAWWYDARKAAGAPATLRFYAHAAWSPPLGWIPWIVVAALGVLALLAFSAVATLGPGRDRRSPPRAAT